MKKDASPNFHFYVTCLFITAPDRHDAASARDKIRAAQLFSCDRIEPQQCRFAAFAHQNHQQSARDVCLQDFRVSTNRHCRGVLISGNIGLIGVDLVENCCKDSDKAGDHDEGRAEQQTLQLGLDAFGRWIKRLFTRPLIPIIRL